MGLINYWPFRPDPQTRFEQLLSPHLKRLYHLAYRYTGKRDDAEDLVQDLLLKLYPRLDEMLQVDKLAPWLARVLYRLFIDQLRKQQRSPIDLLDDEDVFYQIHAGTPADPADVVNAELTQEMINSALQKLKQDHRILLAMHDIEGYNLQEISNIIDVPIGTVKSRLSRARNNLREIIRRSSSNKIHSLYKEVPGKKR